jgi:hypothetical protein
MNGGVAEGGFFFTDWCVAARIDLAHRSAIGHIVFYVFYKISVILDL